MFISKKEKIALTKTILTLTEEILELREQIEGRKSPKTLSANLDDCFREMWVRAFDLDLSPAPTLHDRIKAIEKFLNVKYVEEKETTEFKGYKVIENKKKVGRPKGSKAKK